VEEANFRPTIPICQAPSRRAAPYSMIIERTKSSSPTRLLARRMSLRLAGRRRVRRRKVLHRRDRDRAVLFGNVHASSRTRTSASCITLAPRVRFRGRKSHEAPRQPFEHRLDLPENASRSARAIMLGPSLSAGQGSGCVSKREHRFPPRRSPRKGKHEAPVAPLEVPSPPASARCALRRRQEDIRGPLTAKNACPPRDCDNRRWCPSHEKQVLVAVAAHLPTRRQVLGARNEPSEVTGFPSRGGHHEIVGLQERRGLEQIHRFRWIAACQGTCTSVNTEHLPSPNLPSMASPSLCRATKSAPTPVRLSKELEDIARSRRAQSPDPSPPERASSKF
jgi:hypothetical protein